MEMTAKIGTFSTKEAIDKGARSVASGAVGNRTLMQTVTIAALDHLDEHGNVNVFAELYKASFAFKSKALHDAWRGYVIEHSWMVFNPNNLTGKALRDAEFKSIFVKDPLKSMDVNGAKLTRWDNQEPDKVDAKPKNFEVEVAAIAKRLTKMLNGGKLLGQDGKPCTDVELRAALRKAITTIQIEAKPAIVALTSDEAVKVAKAKAGLITTAEPEAIAAKAA